MNTGDIVRAVAASGTTMSKARLSEAVRMAPDRDFCFIQDTASKYAVVRIKLVK